MWSLQKSTRDVIVAIFKQWTEQSWNPLFTFLFLAGYRTTSGGRCADWRHRRCSRFDATFCRHPQITSRNCQSSHWIWSVCTFQSRTSIFQPSPLQKYLLHLTLGVDINQTNNHGDTALWVACDTGNEEIVRALLKHPRINIDKGIAHVPLHSAVLHGRENIVRMLLDAGCQVNKVRWILGLSVYFSITMYVYVSFS